MTGWAEARRSQAEVTEFAARRRRELRALSDSSILVELRSEAFRTEQIKTWEQERARRKSKGKKRYLPKAAWSALSKGEKAATNRAKAKSKKQFVKQPKSIARKTARYR